MDDLAETVSSVNRMTTSRHSRYSYTDSSVFVVMGPLSMYLPKKNRNNNSKIKAKRIEFIKVDRKDPCR